MTDSPVVRAIQQRLREDGYTDVPSPFKIAGVEFSFTGVMRGSRGRALDLVILVDTTTGDFGDRDGKRVRQRVEALSRALDVTRSRYVVTVILAGAVLSDSIEVLSQTCRVLNVESVTLDENGKLTDETAQKRLDDRIRVLLALKLPDPVAETADTGGPAMDQLVQALPGYIDQDLKAAVIAASVAGEEAVTEAAGSVINRPFQNETKEGQS
jgi:hypothetical protein